MDERGRRRRLRADVGVVGLFRFRNPLPIARFFSHTIQYTIRNTYYPKLGTFKCKVPLSTAFRALDVLGKTMKTMVIRSQLEMSVRPCQPNPSPNAL